MASETQKRCSPAAFRRKSARARRVAIARDVLAQLRDRRLTAQSGKWFLLEGINLLEENPDAQLSDILQDDTHYSACAIGSLLVSATRLADRLTVRAATGFAIESLRPHFSQEQSRLIEYVFECGDGVVESWELPRDQIGAAEALVAKWDGKTLEERLRAIMRNIVRNGDFVVPRSRAITSKGRRSS